ncbi:MAG: GAF domain-containing protein [Anaerolineaceae bacterium]|nr:GAF domain-containing protein [Anaerolineaceae bacterium]
MLVDRLAILHQLSLDLMQENDPDELLKRIANFACDQVGACYAIVAVQNDTGKIEQCVSTHQQDCVPYPDHSSARQCEELARLLNQDNRTVRIDDIRGQDQCPNCQSFFQLPTPFMGIPLHHGAERLGGVYLLGRQHGVYFSDDDKQVLEMLASYASIGIVNARLNTKLVQHDHLLTQRNESLSLLTHLASTLAEFSNPNEVLDQALAQVMEYLHLAVGEIYLRQEEGWLLKLIAHHGPTKEPIWGRKYIRYGDGPVGMTARTSRPQFVEMPGSVCSNEYFAETCEACNLQLGCFPLGGQHDVLGVLCVGTCHYRPLDTNERDFLMAISAWLGTMLENQQLSQQRQRLAVLEERERIGMDLHDGVIQSIYAVGLTLEHIRLLMRDDPVKARETIDQAIRDLNSTIRDIRVYILDLRPRQLHDEDLTSGIQRLVTEFRANALVNVRYQGPKEGAPELSQTQAIAMFHICQESLANVAKHARATQVNISVWKTSDRLLMEIHDDGRGFQIDDAKFTLGHGLSNMKTRANNVGGEVEITSARGQGANILAWVPIDHQELDFDHE